ncbi:NUDIX domain protein [Clostridium tepidiprofundi DSM 19306]|uniref:NUDIX domain protein n=2 Tax=Clostridium TaxID=1485 RepID=A0A151B6I1_9CLOT|nr:NUDIX domain protein [Clostridium tepidiprofundi DSM 19306]
MPDYKLYNMYMVYNKKNNKVLVQDKVADDGWGGITFPGGHIEFGESFIESAIRGVKEETGFDVTDLEYAGIINYYNTDNSERWMCFLYTCNELPPLTSLKLELLFIKKELLTNHLV